MGPAQPAVSNPGGVNVVGCKHASIGRIVNGSLHLVGENHGKPTFKKKEKVDGSDVMIYFWDARDGEDFSGWWFGPSVGGDLVWAYHGNKASMVPPPAGWTVPFNGEVDNTMKVSQVPKAPQAAARQVGQAQQQATGAALAAAQGAAPAPVVLTPEQKAKKEAQAKEFQAAAAARK